jgi:hypothetical protein
MPADQRLYSQEFFSSYGYSIDLYFEKNDYFLLCLKKYSPVDKQNPELSTLTFFPVHLLLANQK